MNQHVAVALVAVWLIGSSPWVAMLRRIPAGAGWVDYAHVGLGLLALVLSATYTWSCVRDGKWRLYFPVVAPEVGSLRSDIAGLVQGRIPSAEGGGLFGLIEGLLLVALALTAVTGAAWFFTQGSGAAIAWRALHLHAAHGLIVLLVLHVVTVSLHLVDFVRD
jgi:hypothetical protein